MRKTKNFVPKSLSLDEDEDKDKDEDKTRKRRYRKGKIAYDVSPFLEELLSGYLDICG